MGLDMYLTKKTFVKQWEHTPKEKRTTIKVEGWLASSIGADRITNIEEEVGYWRKANHIHQWFVNNVQHGEDDCGEYYVSLDDIKSLAKLCLAVREDNSLAEDLLPVQSGFFFGSTNYDKWYYDSIDYTLELLRGLERELELDEQEGVPSSLYYQASW